MGRYTKAEIEELWKIDREGVYYDNDDIKNNNNSIKGLKKYDYLGNEIK